MAKIPLREFSVSIDPGHGAGREHNRGSVIGNEGDNNWDFVQILIKKFRDAGVRKVGTSRAKKTDDPSLKARGQMSKGYTLFISTHTNAGNSSTRGTEIFPDTNPVVDDHLLAEALSANIATTLGTKDRGVRYWTLNPEKYLTGLKKAPKASNYFGVLRHNLADRYAMLIEHCYHTNYQDCRAYVDNYDRLADTVVSTILNYYCDVDYTTKPKKYADKTGDKFIPAIKDLAIDGWHTHKILPSLTLAQAILESDWGRSELAQNAYAIFGIKAHTDPSWPNTYTKSTKEWSGGKYITINAEFKAYDSWKESIQDRCTYLTERTIGGKRIYKDVIGETDYKEACKKIWEAGYATDPKYPDKLINIIEKNNLNKFDDEALTQNNLSGVENKKMEYGICYWNDGDLANAQALLNVLGGKAFLTKTKNATDLPARTIIQVGGAEIEGANVVLAGENRQETLEKISEWVEKQGQ